MEQHFHREMSELRSKIAELGGLVESCIAHGLNALKTNDLKLVEQVKHEESLIDDLEVQIEEHCLKVLALYQPVAKDLRLIVTILKLINDYERIGDLARKIGLHALDIPKSLYFDSQLNISDMGDLALKMVHMSMDSFLQEDAQMARKIQDLDLEMDQIYTFNRKTITQLIDNQELEFTEAELIILSISRSLERIGDLTTNIAEDVIYLVDATIVRHHGENE